MSNETLTKDELEKIYRMYYNYGKHRLGDFIQMIWGEAYNLGYKDGFNDSRSQEGMPYDTYK